MDKINRNNIKALTTGGLISALYVVITVISVYFFNALSVLSLLIMPIFIAYYSSIYSFKNTIIFNIAILVLTFLSGIIDPLYCLFYVLPTLIVGDIFGLLNKKNIMYYTTIFIQTCAYSITNILAIVLAEQIYDISIIKFIINDDFILNNFSFSFLFVISGGEAVFTTMFVSEKLKQLNIFKKVEKKMPLYGYISIVCLFLLSILFYFINNNMYFLLISMNIIISIPIFLTLFNKLKQKSYVLFISLLVFVSLCYLLCLYNIYQLIPIVFLSLSFLCSLVKIIISIYNKINSNKEK